MKYTEEQLREKVIAHMKEKKLTFDKLAKKLGMSRTTINVFVRGGTVGKGSLENINAFFVAMNKQVEVSLVEQQETRLTDIGYAISMLKKGKDVKRSNWTNKFITLKETIIDGNYELRSVLYMIIGDNFAIPWTPQPMDMFATNWVIVEQEEESNAL